MKIYQHKNVETFQHNNFSNNLATQCCYCCCCSHLRERVRDCGFELLIQPILDNPLLPLRAGFMMAQDGPKMAPRWSHDGLERAQDSSKLAPIGVEKFSRSTACCAGFRILIPRGFSFDEFSFVQMPTIGPKKAHGCLERGCQ